MFTRTFVRANARFSTPTARNLHQFSTQAGEKAVVAEEQQAVAATASAVPQQALQACKVLCTPVKGVRPEFVISWVAIFGSWLYLADGTSPQVLTAIRRINYRFQAARSAALETKVAAEHRARANGFNANQSDEESEFFKKRDEQLKALRNQAAH